MNGTSFIKEIGRSYIVSSFLPAALFVSFGVFIFRGFVPSFILQGVNQINSFLGLGNPENFSVAALFILFITTSWVAFYLYSSINWTIQLYEGYKFPWLIAEVMKLYFRITWHRKQIPIYEKRRKEFETPPSSKDIDLSEAKDIALAEIENIEGFSPIDEDDILPTRLGNVLRASECYADERYKLNSLVMFPKLLHVLPQSFVHELEDKNNRFIFLVHSSFLSYIVGILALSIGVFDKLLLSPICSSPLVPNWITKYLCEAGLFQNGLSLLSNTEYMFVGIFFLTVGYVLYRVSVTAAREFALQIRASFDLYRFDLLRQLNHRLPITLNDEKQIWQLLSEYFVAGNRLRFAEVRIQYHHSETKSERQPRE
ncbi:MAG: hypothetical protein QM730_15835 [Anaerolineales bacterium]